MIEPYYKDEITTLYNGDNGEVLPQLEQESVDMIFTSPPYLKEKKYERGMTNEDYGTMINKALYHCREVIKPTGLMFLNINGHIKFPELPFVIWNCCIQNGWQFVQEIVWLKRDATHFRSNKRLTDTKEWIFLFSAGDDYKIYPKNVMIDSCDQCMIKSQ